MNIKRLRLLPVIAFVIALSSSIFAQTTCPYTIIMNDAAGNGWNGGVITVTNGALSTPFTLAGGFADTMTFDVTEGVLWSASWAPGQFPFQVSYKILNAAGAVVVQAAAPNMPPAGIIFSGIGDCSRCSAPLNFRVYDTSDTLAELRWSASPVAPNPQWRIIYGPAGFNLAAGEGDTVYTSVAKLILDSLTKKTAYDAYIDRDCGVDGWSPRVGPVSFQTRWTRDITVIGVVSPVSGCALGRDTVRILIKNVGIHPESLIPFGFSINGTPVDVHKPQDGVYTGVLGKDSVEVFEFETTYDFSNSGEYKIEAYTKSNPQFMGDGDLTNDTFTYYFTNRLISPYNQGFENWGGGWQVVSEAGVPSFEYGTPNKPSIPKAASGQFAWVTDLSETYNANEITYLESPCFDFQTLGTADPAITFSIAYDLQSGRDGAWLEVSVNNGQTWTKVGTLNEGLHWYNEEITAGTAVGDAWSGNSGGWVKARHFLDGAGGKSEVRLRFAFASDATVELGGLGIDDIRIFPAQNHDLAGYLGVVSSESDICGLENEPVTFTFTNVGKDNESNFQVAYSVNGGAPVVETVTSSISADQQRSYTFAATFDSRDALSVIKAWTKLSNDQAPANDTATFIVDHRPLPTPFQEDFEGEVVPQGWTTDGVVTNEHGNLSYVLAVNLNAAHPTSVHRTARYGLISANDSLSFSFRITDVSGIATVLAPNTKFELQVTDNCGASYQTLYTINTFNHAPALGLKEIRVGLAQFAGKSIAIRFVSTWSAGDFWFDVDNINLISCAADMALTAVVKNAGAGQSNGTATVNVGLGNAPYSYIWSNGATTQTAVDLAIGTYTVTVTDSHGCTGVLEVTIGLSATVEIEGLSALYLRPNPTSGQAIFRAEFDREVKNARLQVVNLLGQPVWEATRFNTALISENIDLTQFPDGLYLLRLTVDGQMATKKLLKNGGR